MKLKRQKRNRMNVKEAADFLEVCPQTIRNMIAADELTGIQRKPGTTSPFFVYEAEVKELAAKFGII